MAFNLWLWRSTAGLLFITGRHAELHKGDACVTYEFLSNLLQTVRGEEKTNFRASEVDDYERLLLALPNLIITTLSAAQCIIPSLVCRRAIHVLLTRSPPYLRRVSGMSYYAGHSSSGWLLPSLSQANMPGVCKDLLSASRLQHRALPFPSQTDLSGIPPPVCLLSHSRRTSSTARCAFWGLW